MKALRFHEPYKAEIVDVSRPEIRSAHQMIIKVEACGICASDVMAYKGTHPYRTPPVITGHECAGTVVETGSDVKGFKVGDRIAVEPHLGCGECRYCKIGEYQQCVDKGLIGVGDWIGVFAEYIVIEEPMAYKLPESVPFEIGSLLEPYNVGVHAVRRAKITDGESIGVVGAGTIGLATLLATTKEPHGTIYVTDISNPKLETALAIGADFAINALEKDPLDEVLKREKDGLDVVFLAVPSEKAIDQALSICKPQGRLILIATLGSPVPVNTFKIQQFERSVIGTAMYNRDDWLLSLEHLKQDTSGFEKLISNRISLSEAIEEIAELAEGNKPENIKTIINSLGD